jgi:hypothetical protein
VFQPGSRRAISNLAQIQLLTLDFDNKHTEGSRPSGAEVAEHLDRLGIASVLYSTYSSTPEKERFRVVVPLERPLRSSHWQEDWLRLSEWALDRLGLSEYRKLDGCIDLGALHLAGGLNFLPCNPCLDSMKFYVVDGNPLPLPLEEIRSFQMPVEIIPSQGYRRDGTNDLSWTEPFGIDFSSLRLRLSARQN